MLSSIKPKLDIRLFVDFCVFFPFLHVLSTKLFCFDLQNNFLLKTGKNREKHKNEQTIGSQVLA